MTIYERRCRILLKAFPEEYRSGRGEELIGVLLDTATPTRRWPSLRPAAGLVAAGLRVRARLSHQGRVSVAVIEGMRQAALIGLCVQAAFAVAMVVHRAHDGFLFYAPNNAWSTGALDVLAAAWVVAFVLMVADRFRLAAIPAVLASGWSVILFLGNFGGNFKDALPSDVLLAVQMTLLGVVPTLALCRGVDAAVAHIKATVGAVVVRSCRPGSGVLAPEHRDHDLRQRSAWPGAPHFGHLGDVPPVGLRGGTARHARGQHLRPTPWRSRDRGIAARCHLPRRPAGRGRVKADGGGRFRHLGLRLHRRRRRQLGHLAQAPTASMIDPQTVEPVSAGSKPMLGIST